MAPCRLIAARFRINSLHNTIHVVQVLFFKQGLKIVYMCFCKIAIYDNNTTIHTFRSQPQVMPEDLLCGMGQRRKQVRRRASVSPQLASNKPDAPHGPDPHPVVEQLPGLAAFPRRPGTDGKRFVPWYVRWNVRLDVNRNRAMMWTILVHYMGADTTSGSMWHTACSVRRVTLQGRKSQKC